MSVEELDSESFPNKLAEVIVSGPLYKVLRFTGKVTVPVGARTTEEGLPLPTEFAAYCADPRCRREQQWKFINSIDVSAYEGFIFRLKQEFVKLIYRCKNCETRIVYVFLVDVDDDGGMLTKVGQFPPLEREPSGVLASAMDQDDLILYKHGLTCRNSHFGIGAVAYLRRIVENRINYLLDLLGEAAINSEPESPLIEKLVEMKKEKRFTEKIAYAAELLPKSLKRNENPIATLHELTSAGLHGESDDECVEIFDRCKLAFEHVIKRLKADKEEDEGYKNAIKVLSERAAKKKGKQ